MFVLFAGHCPTQLEWDMKLWWVHCEAMISLLMIFVNVSPATDNWNEFKAMADYTLQHVRYIIYCRKALCAV